MATDENGNYVQANQFLDVVPALNTSNGLDIRDRALVKVEGGGYALLSNSGAGLTRIGVEAHTGGLSSFGPVDLRDRSRVHGNLYRSATPALGNNVIIDGQQLSFFGLPPVPAVAPTFPSPGAAVTLGPDQTATISAGSFGAITVSSRATLTLGPGVYYFQSIQLEPQARIIATGGVVLHVASQTIDRGTFTGFGSSDIYLYGSYNVVIENSFLGRLFVPNASLYIRSPVTTSFLAVKNLVLDAAQHLTCR